MRGLLVYFEYVESDANPSVGLSREGLDAEWTIAQGRQLMPVTWPRLLFTPFDSLSHALLLA